MARGLNRPGLVRDSYLGSHFNFTVEINFIILIVPYIVLFILQLTVVDGRPDK